MDRETEFWDIFTRRITRPHADTLLADDVEETLAVLGLLHDVCKVRG